MPKVLVLKKGLFDAEIAGLIGLAEAAGCVAQDVEIIESVGEPEPDGHDEIVMILLSPMNCQPGELDEEIAKIPNGGRRAIGIWPEDAAGATIPDTVGKFSYSVIAWDPERLRAIMQSDDVVFFDAADGAPLPAPNQDHLECE